MNKNGNYSNIIAMDIDKDHIRLGRDSDSILSARQQNARLEYQRKTGIKNYATSM